MEYNPQPIDTSDVVVDKTLQDLSELLAKNTHEVWAEGKMSAGWTYAPKRDNAKMHHPCLISYEALPEREKKYDRDMSIETVKLIQKLGYSIEAPQTVTTQNSAYMPIYPKATMPIDRNDEQAMTAFKEARHLYIESTKKSKECVADITEGIRKGHGADYHFDTTFVGKVLETYGAERVNYVLATIVKNHSRDDRYSQANKDWAESILSDENQKPREVQTDIDTNAHPVLVNAVVDTVREQEGKSYRPNPEDTSDVEIDKTTKNLSELLARNAHDIWAKSRIEEGWVYGETEDGESKTHPFLCPYEQLTDEQKGPDLRTALETVKLVQKLGFRITPSDSAASSSLFGDDTLPPPTFLPPTPGEQGGATKGQGRGR